MLVDYKFNQRRKTYQIIMKSIAADRRFLFGWALAVFVLQFGQSSAENIRSLATDKVVLEVWTAPQYDWDEQTGEKDGPNIALFATLKEVAIGFGDAIEFEPNMYINAGDSVCSVDSNGNPLEPSAKQEVCDANCVNGHRYCAVPPTDAIHADVQGKALLAESLRRMCIWDIYGQDQDGNWSNETNYFEYLQGFHEARCDARNFSKDCVGGVIVEYKMNVAWIQNCFVDSGGIMSDQENPVYQKQVDAQKEKNVDALDSLPAVMVNGELQTEVTADALFDLICKQLPKDKVPDDICGGKLEETLGDDEDKEEEKVAEKELEAEIAADLGEDEKSNNEGTEKESDDSDSEGEENLTPEQEADVDEKEAEKEQQEEEKEEVEWKEEKEEKEEAEVPADEHAVEKEEEKLEDLEAADAGIDATPDHANEGAVVIEVWTTPNMDWDPETGKGDGPNIKLFDHLKEVVLGFGEKISFRPQMYISSQDDVCKSETTDEAKRECGDMNCSNNHRYCAVAPDDWKLTGESLVEESLRRLCLWEVYGRNDDGEDDVLYFDYLAKFHELKCDNVDYEESCISSVFSDVNIKPFFVNACINNSGGLSDEADNEILKEVVTFQKATFEYNKLKAEQVPILLINGKPLEGALEKSLDELFGKVCEEFPTDKQPDVCSGDLKENLGEDEGDPEAHASDMPEAAESEAPESEASSATESPTEAPLESKSESSSESETLAPQPNITAETSSPNGVWDLDSAGTSPPLGETTEESVERGGDASPEEGVASPNAPDTTDPSKLDSLPTPTTASMEKDDDDDSLNALDFKVIDTAIEHLAVLQKCEVDTAALVSNLLALGGTDGHFKDAAETIESDIPMLMSKSCPHDQGQDILNRMEDFHKCAMFDLQELIETFPSTAVGVMMRCASAYSNMTKEEEEKGFIPEQCIRTVEADSVLGRGFFGLYLYPDIACPCFEKLHDGIPECTADVWPIPINGAQVKVQSCLVGQYCQAIDGICEENLQTLHECLPPKGTNPADMVCSDIFEKCSTVYDNVPPMLSAAPLPDACLRIAEGSKFYGEHVVERYDTFRHKCGENIELWEGHTPIAEFKNFVTHGVMGIDYRSLPFMSGALGGFFAGIVFCIVVVIVRKFCLCVQACFRAFCDCCCGRCRKKKVAQRPKSKEYSTVITEGDDELEYRD